MDDQTVIRICADHGLQVAEVRRNGPMLQLVPSTLDDLPPPDAMREISAALVANEGVRYVTLLLEEAL